MCVAVNKASRPYWKKRSKSRTIICTSRILRQKYGLANFLWNPKTSTLVHLHRISVPPDITTQVSLFSSKKEKNIRPLLFEEDCDWIVVDTFLTYCLTNNMNDFYPKPQHCNHRVLVVSNTPRNITYGGQAAYTVTDNNGSTHVLHVPEMYYCATIPYRVL
jgi:hypothetical protein